MNVPVHCTSCGWEDTLTREDLKKDPVRCSNCGGKHLELRSLLKPKKVRQSKVKEGETPRPVPGSVATAVFRRLAERHRDGAEEE